MNQNAKHANQNLLAESVEKLNLPHHLRLQQVQLHQHHLHLLKKHLMLKLLQIHHPRMLLQQKMQNLLLMRVKLKLLTMLQHHQQVFDFYQYNIMVKNKNRCGRCAITSCTTTSSIEWRAMYMLYDTSTETSCRKKRYFTLKISLPQWNIYCLWNRQV